MRTTRLTRPYLIGFMLGTATLFAVFGHARQQDASMANMPGMKKPITDGRGNPCDDMSSMGGMSVMGESMAAMQNHMCITPLRPIQPGDEERARALIEQVKAAIEKYKDYKKALADGYVIANPNVEQPQYHFTNGDNTKLADSQFDPARPTSLLYYRTATQRYRLEGVMYTDRVEAGEEELNRRIPLSLARWHKHTNFCAAPADKVQEYLGEHPKFGMFGSLYTKDACQAAGGTYFPVVFNWMVHVFPYEDNFKDIFSTNDDIPHFH